LSLKKVVAEIKKHKSFLITAHTNLEGDALGSELAFYFLVKSLGKDAMVVNEDETPAEYQFLPGTNIIKRYRSNMKNLDFDCFVAVDCSDPQRTGEVYRLNKEQKPVINVDHHISNKYFGDTNWVDPHASSASEMVFELYKKMGVKFSDESALCLYVGIMMDTGSFRYSNTTSTTHRAVSELLKHKINVVEVYKYLHENIPYQDMRLLAKLLPTFKRTAGGKIIWCQIKHNLLKNKRLAFDLTDSLLTYARAIKDMEVCVLLKENLGVHNEVRINLRSQGKVDVNKIAASFGGGGHKTAAGATIQGNINSIRRKVLAKIKENLK